MMPVKSAQAETWKEVCIELTAEESEECSAVSYTFRFSSNGNVHIIQDWGDTDELYSSEVTLRIPARVWQEAMRAAGNQ